MSLISEDLQLAIEQLRPELPELLSADHVTFVTQLETFLAEGNEDRMWNLFGKYPIAHERLVDILDKQEKEQEETTRGGFGLYGDPMPSSTITHYRCETGSHIVAALEVEERDAAGNALCPQHHTRMIVEKRNEPGQSRE